MKIYQKIFVFLVIFLTWLVLGSRLLFCGPKNGGFRIFGVVDNLWHLGLIAEVDERGLPVQNPGTSGIVLKNYNYLSDLIFGLVVKILNISAWKWYFYWGNFLTIGGFLLSVFWVAKKISQNFWTAVFSTLCCGLGGTASFLIPLINRGQKEWYPGSFLLNAVSEHGVNLHIFLGLTFFILSINQFFLFLGKGKTKNGLLAGFFVGVIFGIKAYYFLPVFIALFLTSLKFLFKKKTRFFIPLTISLLVAGVFWIIFVGPGQKNIPFQIRPFWLLEKMIEEGNRFYWPKRILLDQHYRLTKNIPRLMISQGEKLALYLVGNFWLRWIGITWLFSQLKGKNKDFYLFCLVIIFSSMLMPLFLVPNPNHFNAVQFGDIAMLLSAFFVPFAFTKKPWLAFLVFIIFIPTAFKIDKNFFQIDKEEYQALMYLKNYSQAKEGIVDLLPSHRNLLVVPALSQRRTFLSGINSAQLVGIDFQAREKWQEKLILGKLNYSEFEKTMRKNNLKYLLAEKEIFDPDKIEKYQLQLLWESSKIAIFLFP